MKKILSTIVVLFSGIFLFAQMPMNGLDVQHYSFFIRLNDSNNIIQGKAIITTGFLKPENQIVFDLVNKKTDGKGMLVNSVTKNGVELKFEQNEQHLILQDKGQPGSENIYTISYEGIPADGLIISNNKYGARTFFGDNWPNRAHNWIPCNDHLSDKATVDFFVTAPDHYQVVSNGKKIEETNLDNHLKLTHWKEEAQLPTKVMVIGVTDFAVNNYADVDCIPVSTWVYPPDRDSGFAHYAIAKNILQFYINHIGPYAFEKLANVQSTTIFGGMENASCIFYFEKSVNSKGIESLMAHEIAHQWFGDNVTEKDWPHLWLSEGFATYMTDLYLENKYGKDSLQNLLRTQRAEVIGYSKEHKTPVVDTSESLNLMKLLNDNSYQKGAWVLHMLRRKLGDSLFWKGIRSYYKTYYGKNASTLELEKVFENVSHQNLETFFKQWLFKAGQPMLNVQWSYDKSKKSVSVKIEQTQSNRFKFPLQISFEYGEKGFTKTIDVKDKTTQTHFSIPFEPNQIIIDPNVDLLFGLQLIKNTDTNR
ncbi:MAG: M1 family metallopeptidase [Ginsengibacter sp.]